MKVKDFSVSQEFFELVYHKELDVWATHPQPTSTALQDYYKSDNYISHTDAKATIFEKVYQIIKRFNLRTKYRIATQQVNFNNKSSLKILDIGCGTGDFLKFVSDKNHWVRGVEPNEKARQLAQDKVGMNQTIYETLESLQKEENTTQFDIITLWHVLEHIPNYDDYLQKIKNSLTPNGRLVIAVPNFNSFDAQYYKTFWAAYDVPRHLWHFSRKAIHSITQSQGLKVVHTYPMYWDAFYVALLSEQYKTGRKHLLKSFLIGVYSNTKAVFTKEYSSLIYVIHKN